MIRNQRVKNLFIFWEKGLGGGGLLSDFFMNV